MVSNLFMSLPLQHARHNKQACDFLNDNGSFPDWVATTAFYCAMHYAHAAIFPFIEVGTTYNNIEEYFNKHKKVGETKHSVTLDLIQKKHFSISAKYHFLKDIAHTARYHDYNIHSEVVKKARRLVNKIEEYCEDICAKKASEQNSSKES
jgi:hypothetical protein